MSEVVITGIGVVCPLGEGVEALRKGMFAGNSGIVPIRGQWVPEDFPVPYAGIIDRNKLSTPKICQSHDWTKVPKSWLFTALSSEEALKDFPKDLELDGIVYGTADGLSFDIVWESQKNYNPENFDERLVRSESPLNIIQDVLAARGNKKVQEENFVSINSACATGNQTLGVAFQRIQSGEWKRCLAGGVDARCEASNLMNFYTLGALTTDDVAPEKASRPFALDRSGFVRGEASATLLLESRESAEARGAKIYGKITGYGMTSDAYRLTDGRDDGLSVIHAMKTAVQSSGSSLDEVDYINAHGTSTPLNDRLESKSIKTLFGDNAKNIPISSLKSQIGHSTIASGAVEAIACLLMIEEQKISPTINYNHADPECDLDYVPNVAREAKLNKILSNSLGFGGQNACLLFERWEKT
ncbi:MAG: beta-ketoacyl-[acyl-carrier-protein] synthase family protein [Proteobacteria bacterium]|nr:beta-ketoacyl-[acyl-carrier-protein] synthase family protein [Pseudomonadota bacterium]